MYSTQRAGVFLLILAAVGYAFMPVITKVGYEAGLQPLQMLTWRFIIAAPAIWVMLVAAGAHRLLPALPRWPLLLMGVLFAGSASFAFFALQRIPASTYTVLIYIYPAFVALFSLLAGEKIAGRGWLALGLTLVGIVLTVPNLTEGLAQSDPFGMLLAVINGATYAVYIVISSRLLRGQSALAGASALSITGSVLALVALALFTGLDWPATSAAWLSIIALGLVSTVLPVFAFYAGLQRLGAPNAAILSTLEPVFVLILSFFLLDERLQPVQILGAALILTSAVLLQLRRAPRIAPAVEPAVLPETAA